MDDEREYPDEICQDDYEWFTGTGVYALPAVPACERCADRSSKSLWIVGIEHWYCDTCYQAIVEQRSAYHDALKALHWD